MAEAVMVEIPVTPAAAEALGDLAQRERIGKLISSMLRPNIRPTIRWLRFSLRSKVWRAPTG